MSSSSWLAAAAAAIPLAADKPGGPAVDEGRANIRYSLHMGVELALTQRRGWPRARPAIYFKNS